MKSYRTALLSCLSAVIALSWLLLAAFSPFEPTRSASAAVTTQGFGVSSHFMWYSLARAQVDIDRIQQAGFNVARFDVGWRWIEPVKGSYDSNYLAKLDGVLNMLQDRGIQPIITLLETPDWARNYTGTMFTPPSDMANYAQVYGMLASRYAARPNMIYEVWNEPNDIHFWDVGPNAAQYTQMLKLAYDAIKAVAPTATVNGGVIAFNDRPFLRGMYAAGAAGKFDGLSLHPYTLDHAPDWIEVGQEWYSFAAGIPQMAQVMADNGEPNKPIYITEMGWRVPNISEAQRASYYHQAVAMVRNWPNVKVFASYTQNQILNNDDALWGHTSAGQISNLAPYSEDAAWGLIMQDGVPTSSWQAYSKAVNFLNLSEGNCWICCRYQSWIHSVLFLPWVSCLRFNITTQPF